MPERYEAIILKCIAKKQEDRYQNTRDLAADVAEAMRENGCSLELPLADGVEPGSAQATAGGNTVAVTQIGKHTNPGNQTRVVVVAREGVSAPTGHDRTALVIYQRADEPGSLISILQEFAARRINLSNLLSRPTKDGGLGDYCFIVYADGHIADELVADAMRALRAKQGKVKFLGSYPAAGEHAHEAREHADLRWRDADDWVSSLRNQIRTT